MKSAKSLHYKFTSIGTTDVALAKHPLFLREDGLGKSSVGLLGRWIMERDSNDNESY